MQTKRLEVFKFVAVALLAVSALSACSAPNKPIDLTTAAALIDVRTPEEFSAGHLQNAINISVESSTWASEIAALDKEADYVLYCRSGRRSQLAIDYMTQNGFTGRLTNAGGLEQAAEATGLAVIVN